MRKLVFALAAALALCACAGPQKYAAADDIHAFLTAVRDNDRALFDVHVDRRALSRQLEQRIVSELPSDPVSRSLGAVMAGPTAGVVTNLLAQPRVFRAVAVYNGYDPAKPLPPRALIAQVLKSAGDGRVCIGDAKRPCTLVFSRAGDVWRLTAFLGDLKELRAGL